VGWTRFTLGSEMAGEIFVGSVAVSVVPDLRGFNDKVRSELVPSANDIGQEIGKEIASGIVESLDLGSAIRDSYTRDKADIAATGYEAGRTYGSEMRRGIDESLRDIRATVHVNVDTASARTDIDRLSKDVTKGIGGARTSGSGGGFLSNILSALGFGAGAGGAGGGGGGAGGAAGAAGGGAGETAGRFFGSGIISGFASLNPYVQAAIGAAVAVALPFIGQAVSGAVVSGFGLGLAAIAIYGAAQYAPVTAAFDRVKTQFTTDIKAIGASFVPVLLNIANAITVVLGELTPVFQVAARTIAAPFQAFADAIIRSFGSPVVKQSIQEVAVAFAGILRAITPQIPAIANAVAGGITAMATAVAKNPKAFADFLVFLFKLPGYLFDALAALTNVADWIEAHWSRIGPLLVLPFQVFRASIEVLMGAVQLYIGTILELIQGHWSAAWDDIRAGTDRILNAIVELFRDFWHALDALAGSEGDVLRHNIASHFDEIRQDNAQWGDDVLRDTRIIWNDIYSATIGSVIRIHDDVLNWQNRMYHDIANVYDIMRHNIAVTWDATWSDTVGMATRGAQNLMGVFNNLKNDIVGFFRSADSWLTSAGSDVIQGLLNGIRDAMSGIGNWVKNYVVNPVVNAVKHFFGISSPATVMMPIGANIMQGIIQGLLTSGANLGSFVGQIFGGWPQALGSLVSKSLVDITKLPAKALNALGGIAGKVGGVLGSAWHKIFGGGATGVNQWAGTVMQALAMLHLPMSLLGQVLYQMQTESGGNVNAINLTDINAQMGDPSRGLMQVIGSTFAAFHVPGTSSNIYDPLANIAAALNYAMHVYGPSLMSGGMGLGSGHGYDEGGWVPPGLSLFNNGTGQPELAIPMDQLQRYGELQTRALASIADIGGTEYHAHFDGLTYAAIESHVQTAFKAMSLTAGALNRQGRRS
jgi:SLT domain-containing protein